MGGSGGIISSIFGGGSVSTPEVPEYKPTPVRENEAEAEAKTVRDEEKRKLKARSGMSWTILTSPLGVSDEDAGKAGVLGAGFKG